MVVSAKPSNPEEEVCFTEHLYRAMTLGGCDDAVVFVHASIKDEDITKVILDGYRQPKEGNL